MSENPYNGGGGYVAGGGGGSPFGSQESGGAKKQRNNTVRPVTIKQILKAEQLHNDADFTIDGHDIHTVLLVGSVHNKSSSATNVSYEIGDGTGYIDVRLWLDSADDDSGKTQGVDQDKYIAVMGLPKFFGGKRHVSATHVRVIQDPNEVYHHLLKALYVSLQLRNPGGGGGGAVQNGTRQPAANDYTANVAQANESAYAALPSIQRDIMEVVAKDDADDGMHVSTVSRAVIAHNSKHKTELIMEAIESLMADGMLFSTIDDLWLARQGDMIIRKNSK